MDMVRTENPKVAAIVCTIARPREVACCAQSLLENTYAPFEVIVVDQRSDDAIAAELRPLGEADARLRYIHTDIAGKTRAQNLAINGSDADLFAFTDDDCVVPPDWVTRIVETFRRLPDAGLLFGEVHTPAEHDWDADFSPSMYFAQEELLRPTFLPRDGNLFGCSMAVTRQTFAHIGLFDEALGPGSSFDVVCEEVDFHLRALRAHPPIGVYLTPAFYVVHEHGNRPQGEAARRLLRTYQLGSTGMLTKHALHGDLGAGCKVVIQAGDVVMRATRNLVRTGRPRGIGMIVPYLRGISRGLRVAHESERIPLERE